MEKYDPVVAGVSAQKKKGFLLTEVCEKTDRLYRNFKDCVILEDLEVEIHLVKEGQIISKDSKSQAKLFHGLQVVMARNYIDNLRDEVLKGMREKAEQGIYPGHPPLGYRNNKILRNIEINPETAPIAQRAFELYFSGECSLPSLRKRLGVEFGRVCAIGYLERLLKNPFYVGQFRWREKIYQGKHPPLITMQRFERVQEVLRDKSHPTQRKHHFAFSGMLRCAHDGCAITAERKKNRYVYYHCTGYRGKCSLPYFREEEIGDRLGLVLKNIYVPDDILSQLRSSLLSDGDRKKTG